MNIGQKIDNMTKEQQQNYAVNLKDAEELERKGHDVEVKTPEIVFIDNRYMIYLSDSRYHDLQTKARDGFKPGTLKTLIGKK